MKKILYSMLAVLAVSFGFVSCGDDDEDNIITYSTTAEKASEGTYSGSWVRVLNDEVVTYTGTVTLTATDSVGYTNVTFSCPEASINATSVANIWNAGNGFQFVNQVSSNGLGATFAGRIYDDGKLTTGFTITQKVGRKSYEFVYKFEGNK